MFILKQLLEVSPKWMGIKMAGAYKKYGITNTKKWLDTNSKVLEHFKKRNLSSRNKYYNSLNREINRQPARVPLTWISKNTTPRTKMYSDLAKYVPVEPKVPKVKETKSRILPILLDTD